jgi:DNA adenine methylase
MKPFLKWAGNKYALIERIRPLLPAGKRLIEPFTGSAAVFLSTDYASAILTDRNEDLISLYQILQKEGDRFIADAQKLFTAGNNSEDVYYAFRQEFNSTGNKRRKAALFLYFNRHGYNGLCRYNAKGGFNVPFGRYTKPYFPAKEMQEFYLRSQCAEFKVADFRETMLQAKAGDVVYCDPPYVPLSRTANFTSYAATGFGEAEQKALAGLAETLAARGVTVVISNHDTDYTAGAYHHASLLRFQVQRNISCNGHNRTKAKELLALFKAA